jgi:hypothetical protein
MKVSKLGKGDEDGESEVSEEDGVVVEDLLGVEGGESGAGGLG